MTLPADYWTLLADDYVAAYKSAFGAEGQTPGRVAILVAMSVAEHETNNGRAWPGTNNFGAVQLRSLTADERAAYHAGTLKSGDYDAAHDGVLHVDTHPLGNGASEPYPVWFAAFPTRVEGVAHFLKTLWRTSESAPDAPDATVLSVVTEMYCGHYFEDRFQDDRPWQARRAQPLSAPEQKDVEDYAGLLNGGGVNACYATICGALGAWDFGRDPVTDPADPTQPMPPLPFCPDSQPPSAA
jgi:hypothetical protein